MTFTIPIYGPLRGVFSPPTISGRQSGSRIPAISTDELVLAMAFDDADIAGLGVRDYSSFSHHGQMSGPPASTTGSVHQARSFTASTSYIRLPSTTTMVPYDYTNSVIKSISIASTVKVDGHSYCVFSSVNGTTGYWALINTDGSILFAAKHSGSTVSTVSDVVPSLLDGGLHDIVITCNRTGSETTSIYVDNVLVHQDVANIMGSETYQPCGIEPADTGIAMLPGAQYGYTGIQDETAVWHRVLTADEIRRIHLLRTSGLSLHENMGLSVAADADPYGPSVTLLLHFEGANNSTALVDSSPRGRSFSRQGGAVISTSLPLVGTSSGSFDGTLDSWNAPINTLDDFAALDYTLEGKASLNTVGGSLRCLLSHRSATGADAGWFVFVDTTGQLYFTAPGSIMPDLVSPGSITAGVPFDWAVSRVGGSTRLFLNGLVVDTAVSSYTMSASDGLLYVGSSSQEGGTREWLGKQDSIRISRGLGRYTGAYVPSTLALPSV